MNKLTRPLALICLPILPVSLFAESFSPALVPAEARWVVHVDFDHLRESAPGKKLLAAVTAAHPAMGDSNIKIDLQKVLATLSTLTAYGSNFSQDPKAIDGTLVVQGSSDLRKIVEGLVAEATVSHPEHITETKELSFEAYTVTGGKDDKGTLIVGFPKEPIILLGKSKPHLEQAYAVFRRKAPSLLTASSTLGALVPKEPGAYILAASVIPSEDVFPKNAPHARVLQMANSGSFALGENAKLTYAHLQLGATSGEMAEKLMKIIQGMTAMLSLAESNDKQLEEFAKSVTVQRQDNNVRLSISYPSERVAEMIAKVTEDRPHRPMAPAPEEKTVATWKGDKKATDTAVEADSLVTRTIENVKLSNGAQVTLAARRETGESARIDYVEIVGQGSPSAPLHFEAESLRANGFRSENASYASGGKLLALSQRNGTARLQFPGLDGLYTIKVRYLDDPNGTATFTLTTREPEAVVHE